MNGNRRFEFKIEKVAALIQVQSVMVVTLILHFERIPAGVHSLRANDEINNSNLTGLLGRILGWATSSESLSHCCVWKWRWLWYRKRYYFDGCMWSVCRYVLKHFDCWEKGCWDTAGARALEFSHIMYVPIQWALSQVVYEGCMKSGKSSVMLVHCGLLLV